MKKTFNCAIKINLKFDENCETTHFLLKNKLWSTIIIHLSGTIGKNVLRYFITLRLNG